MSSIYTLLLQPVCTYVRWRIINRLAPQPYTYLKLTKILKLQNSLGKNKHVYVRNYLFIVDITYITKCVYNILSRNTFLIFLPVVVLVCEKMKENKKIESKIEIHVGPQVNCGDNVGSVEINEETNLICNCSKVH